MGCKVTIAPENWYAYQIIRYASECEDFTGALWRAYLWLSEVSHVEREPYRARELDIRAREIYGAHSGAMEMRTICIRTVLTLYGQTSVRN